MKRTSSMQYLEKSAEADELYIYIVNDYALYQRVEYIIKSLAKKMAKGIYDADKAVDVWYYLVNDGAKKYGKEYGGKFTVAERFTTAVDLEARYREDVEYLANNN